MPSSRGIGSRAIRRCLQRSKAHEIEHVSRDDPAMSAPQTTATATTTDAVMSFYVPMRSDVCNQLSNLHADEAVEWGLRGKSITAERCAELAECYALLAYFYDMADMMRGRFQPPITP